MNMASVDYANEFMVEEIPLPYQKFRNLSLIKLLSSLTAKLALKSETVGDAIQLLCSIALCSFPIFEGIM